jgi:hypothetical protein
MASIPTPVAEPQASISPFGRIIGVFFSPTATFEDIVRKPSWLPPVAFLILTGIILNLTMAFHVNWTEVSKEQIANSKFASRQFDQLDDTKKEEAYQRAANQGKISRYVRGVIGWPILLLVSTSLYFGAYKLVSGARVSYWLAFVLVAFATLPLGIREMLGTLVTALKDPTTINPENYIATNVAAVLPPDAPAWQLIPLAFLDIFTIWSIILVAIAFSTADPKKVPFGKSIGIAAGMNVTLIVLFTTIAWVFS